MKKKCRIKIGGIKSVVFISKYMIKKYGWDEAVKRQLLKLKK